MDRAFAHKHEDKSSYPQNVWESLARIEVICNPNPWAGEMKTPRAIPKLVSCNGPYITERVIKKDT